MNAKGKPFIHSFLTPDDPVKSDSTRHSIFFQNQHGWDPKNLKKKKTNEIVHIRFFLFSNTWILPAKADRRIFISVTTWRWTMKGPANGGVLWKDAFQHWRFLCCFSLYSSEGFRLMHQAEHSPRWWTWHRQPSFSKGTAIWSPPTSNFPRHMMLQTSISARWFCKWTETKS